MCSPETEEEIRCIFDDNWKFFAYFFLNTYVVGEAWRFSRAPTYAIPEAILMSTHNISFYEDLTKVIFQLSSNTHLISSSAETSAL